jgi:hypothetical protein
VDSYPKNWTSLVKSPLELHTLTPNRPWDLVTREHLIRIGHILPLECRPTLRLTPAERERYESQAREQAAQCSHAEMSDEYPCTQCVEKYSRVIDQGADGTHQPCVNMPEPGQVVDYYA